MTILVLMATHNGMAHLPEQVQSIQAQQGVDVQLLAYDDQSTDATPEWLDEHGIQRLLTRPERLGPAGAFVHLLLTADLDQSEAIALADQDDLWSPDKLQQQLKTLRGDALLAGVSSNVTAFWQDGRRQLINKAGRFTTHDHLLESAGPGCTYLLSRAFVDALRAAWTQHGLTPLEAHVRGRPHHDWLLYASARALGWRWVMSPQPLVLYRQHAQNVFGVNRGWRGKWARLQALMNRDFQERQFELVALVAQWGHDTKAEEWLQIAHAPGLRARFQRALWLFRGRRHAHEGLALAFAALVGLWS